VVSPPVAELTPAGNRVTALRRAFHRTRLSVRLALLTALLAAGTVAASFTALSVQVRASTRQLFTDELARNQRTLAALQRDSRRHLVLSAAVLAESPSLRSAIATYRVERQSSGRARADLTATVERELEHLGDNLGGGALLVTDERGRVFAASVRAAAPPPAGTDVSALPAVRNALDPRFESTLDEPYLSGLELGDAYYAVGVAPLILDGYTIGALVYGERVDAGTVRRLRTAFDGDVVVSAGSRVIAATLPADTAARVVAATGASSGALRIGAVEYLAAPVALGRTQRGTELRLTLLQPVDPAVRGITRTLRRDFLLYGALAVMLAVLGATILARSLLHPLRALIAFIRAGAERERVDHDFDADDASQEIRTLNESFAQLMSSLEGKRRELEQRGADLAAANAVLTDEIRDRERVQQALRESEQQLRQSQKLEAVGTLAGGIAHDFNNLLTVISGFTQIAASQLGRGHPVAADLLQVVDAADSAAALTHQLLAFSRKQVLQPRILDLEGVVSETAGMLRRLIGAQVELRVVHSGEPARVRADPGQLEQVLLNLAVNARDAMPQGGTLTIMTGHEPDADETPRVVLRVSDTGTGMTATVRDRIFEPFFTTKEVGKGTGLGLSTVYGIVAQSGGEIAVESVVGFGTTFVLTFPIATEAVLVDDDAADDASVLVPGRGTVLLVEDEDAIRLLVQRTLEECGYTVLTARSGVEALALARATPRVDVLLTDVLMPQMSGPQLVERFLTRHPAPIVIYMTGHVDDSSMRLELDAEVTLLRKPFTPSVLARTLRAALDQRDAPLPSIHPG
jgi:signal transduction histidine kinase/CheY-like chemotaxis protein